MDPSTFTTDDIANPQKVFGEGTQVGRFRAYFHNSSAASAKMFISIDGQPTDINALRTTESNGTIYDLQGRRLNTTTNSRGIFIIDGHKVVKY